MAATNYLQAIPLTTYNSASLTGSYATMNGTGTEQPIKLLKMYNASTVGITISYDGSTDHDYIPATATLILDLQTNADGMGGHGGHWQIAKNQVIYGKGSAGTGLLYIIGYY